MRSVCRGWSAGGGRANRSGHPVGESASGASGGRRGEQEREQSENERMNDKTKQLVGTIVRAMEDKKAERIVSLDLSALEGGGAVCDAFVICQAESTTQVGAIVDGVEEATLRESGERPWRGQGTDNALWVAMDYGDVMVHVFQAEMRDFYRLEELWGDAPATEYTGER